MKGKTKSGFKFDFDERILNDWRFLKAVAKADNNSDPSGMLAGTVELVSMIFGDKEDELMKHIASKNDGYVPQDAIKDELLDIIQQGQILKNSSSSEG